MNSLPPSRHNLSIGSLLSPDASLFFFLDPAFLCFDFKLLLYLRINLRNCFDHFLSDLRLSDIDDVII